jgi:hypothetical protein
VVLVVVLAVAIGSRLVARRASRPHLADPWRTQLWVLVGAGWLTLLYMFGAGRMGGAAFLLALTAVWVVACAVIVPAGTVGLLRGFHAFAAAPPQYAEPPPGVVALLEPARLLGFEVVAEGCFLSQGGSRTAVLLVDEAGRALELSGSGFFCETALASETEGGRLLVTDGDADLVRVLRAHREAEETWGRSGEVFVAIPAEDIVRRSREYDLEVLARVVGTSWWQRLRAFVQRRPPTSTASAGD